MHGKLLLGLERQLPLQQFLHLANYSTVVAIAIPLVHAFNQFGGLDLAKKREVSGVLLS